MLLTSHRLFSIKGQVRMSKRFASHSLRASAHATDAEADSLIDNLVRVAESRWNVPGGINSADIKEELEFVKNAALSLPHAVNLSHNEGSFKGLLTTNNGFVADETTLGRLTFGLLVPEAVVTLNDPVGKSLKPMPSLYKGEFEGRPMSYILNTHFLLRPPGSDPLHGLMTMVAQYSISTDSPSPSLSITFEKMRLSPVDSSQIDSWIYFFKPNGADLSTPVSSDGIIEIHLPQKIKGEVKFILMTREYQMHVGNGGGYYIMKREV